MPDESVQRVSPDFLRSAIENSDVIEYIFKLHVEMLNFSQLRFTTLRLIRKLAKNSADCSRRLISLSAPKFICVSMCTPAFFNDLVSSSVEVIWNTIDHPYENMHTVSEWVNQVGEPQCLLQIRDAFFKLLAQGHSQVCRSIRNDLLTLLILVMKLAATANVSDKPPLAKLGIVKQLAHLVTYEHIQCANPLFKSLRLPPNKQNFDLKKLLFLFLTNLAEDSCSLKTLSETQVINALLDWAYPTSEIRVPNLNETNQREETPSEKEINLETGSTDGASAENSSQNDPSGAIKPTEVSVTESPRNSVRIYNTRLNAIAQWPVAFMEELQLHALDAMSTLCPVLPDDFLLYDGPNRVITLLKWCQTAGDFVGQGNSFHGSGGRHTRRAQMRYTLRLIRSLIVAKDERINKSFLDQDLVRLLVSSNPLRSLWRGSAVQQGQRGEGCQTSRQSTEDDFEVDNIDLEIQSDILFILARICEDNVQQKELFRNEGMTMLLLTLSTLPQRLKRLEGQDVLCNPFSNNHSDIVNSLLISNHPVLKLAIMLVDAIWCCVIGCPDSEAFFVSNQGLRMLLDLLEWYPNEICSQLLGCVIDLTENPQYVPQLLAWCGCRPLCSDDPKNEPDFNGQSQAVCTHDMRKGNVCGPTLPKLLCNLWRWLEPEPFCLQCEPGSEVESSLDLDSQKSRDSSCTAQTSAGHDRLRINIYALFTRMGFRDHENLSTQDRVTICRIERYFHIKNAEVRETMMSEMEVEGLRPTTPDAEVLKHLRHWGIRQCEAVCNSQQQLLREDEEKAQEKEHELYNLILEGRRIRAQRHTFLAEYFKRTSDINYLKEAKLKQRSAIEASRMSVSSRWRLQQNGGESTSDSTDADTVKADVKRISINYLHSECIDGVIDHNTDILGTNVTAFVSKAVTVESTPAELFHRPNKLEAEILEAIAQMS
ncbi:Cilia- and flagella-associated protein 69, variant 2 [Clonorchis sinensis]|nr:Cilia- and flagella-associated protein 69, variant 2 [Clonorchis sinensis]